MIHTPPAETGEALLPTVAEPPGGETAADAADPPEQPPARWRRLRRSRLGVVALLPALLLAAVFVGSPFSGTGTHSVDQPAASPSADYRPGVGSGR
ncbi:MAG: hypothetical protein QOF39_1320 [Frankiales bacterium]|jgi:hypothetical protein|nr:hypothetical protein [Frankiales bacterium]